jgi:ElaB/YqjD/DUF883 family membrane-anchored ribosome-binding protein
MSSNFESASDSFSNSQSTKTGKRGFAEQAGRVGEEATQLGRIALAEAGEVASNLRSKGQDALETGREKALDAKSKLDDFVSTNPLRSVLIAVGIGAVLGYALRRRS